MTRKGWLLAPALTMACAAPANDTSRVDATLKCAQLYEVKKEKYWRDEIGQNKYIFSAELNTCLALNIYNNFDTGSYFAMVIDMVSDKTLLFYTDVPQGTLVDGDSVTTCEKRAVSLEYQRTGKEISDSGCDKFTLMNEMFTQVRAFGFDVQ